MTLRRQRVRHLAELSAVTVLGLAVLLAAGAVVSLLQIPGALRTLLGVYVLLGAVTAGRALLWLVRRIAGGGATNGTRDAAG